MNLKDIFDKAKNGALTWDEFQAAATEANAKFVDLSEGKYVDKQKYDDDLAARDTRITTLDGTIKDREADLANLQTQLKAAGDDSAKLAQFQTDLSTLQTKYDNDTKAYEKQLKDQAYKFAVTKFADDQKFTSNAAKREFTSTMLAKELPMEGDAIVGASDFLAAYTKDNSDAFVVEAPEDPKEPPAPKPHFAQPTNPAGGQPGEPASPFSFNFAGVRAQKKAE